MKPIRTFLLLCLLAGCALSTWARPVVLDALLTRGSLSETGQLLWLADASDTLTIDGARAPENAARFVAAPHPPHPANRSQPYWFKVEMEQSTGAGDWVLATHTTSLQNVDFFGPFDASGRALAPPVHTGLSRPFSTRPLGSERYLARVQLPQPGRYTMYVHMIGGTATELDLSLWEAPQYLEWRQHKRLFDGICYGILLAMLIYNLVLAGIFRDRTYGMYIGQCAFALLTLASYNGHAAHYLWCEWPWWQERANVVLPGLWLVFATLFARSFLDTPRRAPRFDTLLRVVGVLAAMTALLGVVGVFDMTQILTEVVSSVGTLIALLAAVVVMRRGSVPARWYLAGQAALFLSVFSVVLGNWSVIYAPFLQANGLQIGVAAEMVVFAIALSSRIGSMRTNQVALRLRAEHLAQAAATDPLTGLANRAGLAQGAAHLLVSAGAHALMLLDLDRFKPINDVHGHDAGDAVLCEVAARMQANIREGDMVARLGGDEFVVLLAGPLSDERLDQLARRLGDAVRQPVDFQGTALTVGVSIGIARRPRDANTLTGLMRCADQAMYQAKQARSGHAFYGQA